MGVRDVGSGWYKGHDVQIQTGRRGTRRWARVLRIYRETEDERWVEVSGWPADEVWSDTDIEAAEAAFESAKTWIDSQTD